MSIEKDFGKIIKRIRKEQKLTQKEMAEILGCRQTFISNVEVGRSMLPLKDFMMLLNRFDYEANLKGETVSVFRPV